MSTDVSSNPRSGRASATWKHVLAGGGVQICSEALVADAGRTLEHRNRGLGGHEAVPTQRGEFTDRLTVTGDDEGLTLIECAHDLPALIAQLPLGDLSTHGSQRSTTCYGVVSSPGPLFMWASRVRGGHQAGTTALRIHSVGIPASRAAYGRPVRRTAITATTTAASGAAHPAMSTPAV